MTPRRVVAETTGEITSEIMDLTVKIILLQWTLPIIRGLNTFRNESTTLLSQILCIGSVFLP